MESNFGMDLVSFFRGGMRTGKPSNRKPWTRDHTNLVLIIGWCVWTIGGGVAGVVLSCFLPFWLWVSIVVVVIIVSWVWQRFATYYSEKYDLELRW